MASSDAKARGVRHVRCPRCHGLLQEPAGAPVYQCGGCGATLRAKSSSSDDTRGVAAPRSGNSASGDVASTSRSGTLPTPEAGTCSEQHATGGTTSRLHRSGDPVSARMHGSGDVASTSRSGTLPTPDAGTCSEQHATAGTTSRLHGSGDPASARKHGSGDVASTSSTPDVTASRSRIRHETDMASRRDTSDLVSAARRGVSGGDVASTSASTPDHVTASSRRQAAGTTASRPDLVSASKHVPATEKKEHKYEHRADRGAYYDNNSESRRQIRGTAVDGERAAIISPPAVSANNPGGGNRGAAATTTFESRVDAETKRRKSQAELRPDDAARRKCSGEAAVQPRFRDRQGLAPRSPQAAAGGKVPSSPPRHELQAEEDLAPLRQKILKTVDELKGDLSELFSRSPDLNPTTARARPPRRHPLPKQEQAEAGRHASRGTRAAAVNHHGIAARVAAAPPPPRRGLPSRRYRRCRADPPCPCRETVTCHHVHGCCSHHGKPECSSCRGHCGRPSAQERKPAAAAKEANHKRRPPPRHHCRPVLKGAPFIICSSCFELVQVPADFAVSTNNNRLRKLRCGSCSAVLSYSYRDPGRKKKPQEEEYSVDRFGTHGHGPEVHGGGPFAPFVDDFGLSSYSTTEDEQQPLHVSRNTSFDDTVDGVKAGEGRLHRLMGYGSASELLLLRHSPDLYERSFDQRTTTPDYDRKGKSVCIDAEDDHDLDDSDDEDGGVPVRSAARGAVWPMPGMLGKGVPVPGPIRIKS